MKAWLTQFSAGVLVSFGIALATMWIASAEPMAEGVDNGGGVVAASSSRQCVEDTVTMRRNHMKFILHQRDETMYRGIRTSKHSLAGCIDCHAKQDEAGNYLDSNHPQHFCRQCHDFAAVRVDCFQCHNSKPAHAKAAPSETHHAH